MLKWQKIESAPSGKRILVHNTGNGESVIAAFTRLSDHQAVYGWVFGYVPNEYRTKTKKLLLEWEPTHWAAIPAGPAKGKS